jgi:hypothetical protein
MFVLAILRLRRTVMEDIDPQRCRTNHPVTHPRDRREPGDISGWSSRAGGHRLFLVND